MVALVGARSAIALVVAVLLLTACAPWQPGPERSRQHESSPEKRVVESPPAFYQVRRGDTLYSIAFRYGLDWRNVARWNSIQAPYTIRPGQELRMSAPPAPPPRRSASTNPSGSSDSSRSRSPEPVSASESTPETPPPSTPETPAASRAGAPSASDKTRTVAGVAWQWPTQGRLARSFDPADTRKGIGVAGEEGQDVFAAAAGQVVYSGTALIGYGELIIIKHSDKLLSAYGHNRRRMVGEGDRVQRGQKIAEMGRDDRQEEMLHFEIRRDGEPVNPLDYLPRQ